MAPRRTKQADDLQLLTTYHRPEHRHFTTLGDTSAAAALAAGMAGSILAARPQLWPETVRALIVHSAEWTPVMKAHIDECHGAKNRIQALVRRYGYGVPNLARALMSTRNDLTLMVEDELQPFQREGTAAAKTRDMKLHRLPWPREQLANLGAAQVEMRVTLSYFIEPNPGERGWNSPPSLRVTWSALPGESRDRNGERVQGANQSGGA